MGGQYTTCSLNLPHVNITRSNLESLIDEIPQPFIIYGLLNARNLHWGDADTNRKGRIVEQLLLRNNFNILNDGSPTHDHMQTRTTSVIDLAICSADCSVDFTYCVLVITWKRPLSVVLNNGTPISQLRGNGAI